jgi:hypothetical protein
MRSLLVCPLACLQGAGSLWMGSKVKGGGRARREGAVGEDVELATSGVIGRCGRDYD